MAEYLIGTSGWHYDDWQGKFYPEELAKARWLNYYAERFATVELNNSFYRLPSEKAFQNWYESTPGSFVFAVKASRFISHVKRLKDPKDPVDKFMDRAKHLKNKLGPILYQLPPNMRRNDGRLESFLEELPGHCENVIEFRDGSWFEDEVLEMLRRHRVGFCIFEMPSLASPLAATADFAYVRFHGNDSLYSSNYSDRDLRKWADRLKELGKDVKKVYVYFNNDVEGYAVNNAHTLRGYLEKK